MDRQALAPYYQDANVTLHLGDALNVVGAMPDASVDCIVTSPPYFGLRDYGVEGQSGAEETMGEYISGMAAIFREARRVIADSGTLWLNLGDSYSSGSRRTYDTESGKTRGRVGKSRPNSGLPGKNLLGIPWRVALALQDDGWILRNEVIWHKPNAMPESVRDRLSAGHEHLFMFTKTPRYHFDLDAIRIPTATGGKTKNPGDVWGINTSPFKSAHVATFPPELPRRAILAGCKPGGTVLDPFSGSATTGMVALELGRRYVGIDINPEYHDLALTTRLAGNEAA